MNQTFETGKPFFTEETKKFHFVPGEPGPLKVLGFNEKYVVYEATLAELPAPAAVVRELKAFIISSCPTEL